MERNNLKSCMEITGCLNLLFLYHYCFGFISIVALYSFCQNYESLLAIGFPVLSLFETRIMLGRCVLLNCWEN